MIREANGEAHVTRSQGLSWFCYFAPAWSAAALCASARDVLDRRLKDVGVIS